MTNKAWTKILSQYFIKVMSITQRTCSFQDGIVVGKLTHADDFDMN